MSTVKGKNPLSFLSINIKKTAMDPFSTLLAGKLIDIAWDAFSTPVKNYVNSLFNKDGKRANTEGSRLKESDGVASGVAIGYFHNFLKPLDETIAQDRLLITSTKIEEITTDQFLALAALPKITEEFAKQISFQKVEKHTPLVRSTPITLNSPLSTRLSYPIEILIMSKIFYGQIP